MAKQCAYRNVICQFLGIPELMPLRLTRQFVNLLLPMSEKGLLQQTMVHTLRALRVNCALLLNTMDVFIKEPSLDWKVKPFFKHDFFRIEHKAVLLL